jgi:hypothetical protein
LIDFSAVSALNKRLRKNNHLIRIIDKPAKNQQGVKEHGK